MSSKRTEGKAARRAEDREVRKSYLPFVIIGGVLAVAVALGVFFFRSKGPDARPGGASSQPGQAQSPAGAANPPAPRTSASPMPGAAPPRVRGDASAPVTLEEFGDFECPPCAALHPELKKIEAEFGPRLKVIFRHFPLEQMHKNAVAAARAAEAAGRQNRFWEMHDMLYENQNVWKNDADTRVRFAGYAARLGLNVEQFKADMDAPAVMERIIADRLRGRSLGVEGTPTIFLNGRELDPSVMTRDGLRAQIQAAAAGAGR